MIPVVTGFWKPSKKADCFYNPGLYTVAELDQMIFVDGYIPVANIEEFAAIGTETTRYMGSGTCWAGTYAIGPTSKKYVQVKSFGYTSPIAWGYSDIFSLNNSIYDGNVLMISNFLGNVPLIGILVNSKLKNVRIHGEVEYLSSTPETLALLTVGLSQNTTTESVVYNCHGWGVVNCPGAARQGGLIGDNNTDKGVIDRCYFNGTISKAAQSGGLVARNLGVIKNSWADVNIDGGSKYPSGATYGQGGLIGVCDKTSIVENCIANTTGVNGSGQFGGFVGRSNNATFLRCKSLGSIAAGSDYAGGFVGVSTSDKYEDCYSMCSVSGSSNKYIGGFAGLFRPTKCINSYSTGLVTGTGSNTGGFAGGFSGTAPSATYWDNQTSGQSTSAAGVGKTTSDLQTPTSNTGIYANYDPAIWDFGTSSEYPKLKNLPI